MVTVGVLAAIINGGVLLTVTVVDRAIELIVRNFATSRLHRLRSAPVVHDSDTWLLNIPRSVFKYRRYPAILLTVLCMIFLIASELYTEVGFVVSEKCSPALKSGTVISAGDSTGALTIVELGAGASLVQSIKFIDGNLTRVAAGTPRHLTGSECLSCMSKEDYPDIASGCSVKQTKTYKPGELEVEVVTSSGPFATIATGFREAKDHRVAMMGGGDLTGNGDRRAVFVFPRLENATGKTLSYLEYGHQGHLDAIIERARDKEGTPIWEVTHGPVYEWSLECSVNEFSRENFETAVKIYRTIQLENPGILAPFDDGAQRFASIVPDDIYRAVLNMKVIDDSGTNGVYQEYTTCGHYRWKFMAPMMACVIVIIMLGIISWVLARRAGSTTVPYNSRSWSRLVRDKKTMGGGHHDESPSGYFDSINDEMVLVEDEYGVDGQRIVIRSKSKKMSQMDVASDGLDAFYARDPPPLD